MLFKIMLIFAVVNLPAEFLIIDESVVNSLSGRT